MLSYLNEIVNDFLTIFILTLYLYCMGRKKLHRTIDELRAQGRIRSARYYNHHGETVKHKNLRRYYENKRNIQNSQPN